MPESAFKIEEGCCGVLHATVSVVMSVSSADLKFEIMFEGECYGKTRIDYCHDGLMPPSNDPCTDLELRSS